MSPENQQEASKKSFEQQREQNEEVNASTIEAAGKQRLAKAREDSARRAEAMKETADRLAMIIGREERTAKTIAQNRDSGGLFGGFHRLLTNSDPHAQDIARSKQVIGTMRVAQGFLEQARTEPDPARQVELINQARRVSGMREITANFTESSDAPSSAGVNRNVRDDQERYKVEQDAITVSRDAAITGIVGIGTAGAGLALGAAGRGAQVGTQTFLGAVRTGATAGGVIGAGESTVKAVENVQRGAKTVSEAIGDVARDTAIGAGLGGGLGGGLRVAGNIIGRVRGTNTPNARSSPSNRARQTPENAAQSADSVLVSLTDGLLPGNQIRFTTAGPGFGFRSRGRPYTYPPGEAISLQAIGNNRFSLHRAGSENVYTISIEEAQRIMQELAQNPAILRPQVIRAGAASARAPSGSAPSPRAEAPNQTPPRNINVVRSTVTLPSAGNEIQFTVRSGFRFTDTSGVGRRYGLLPNGGSEAISLRAIRDGANRVRYELQRASSQNAYPISGVEAIRIVRAINADGIPAQILRTNRRAA